MPNTTNNITVSDDGRLVTVQITRHYRKVLLGFLEDEDKRACARLYGALPSLMFISEAGDLAGNIGGALITVEEAVSVMEFCDDEVVRSYTTGERNLFTWMFSALHDLNLELP